MGSGSDLGCCANVIRVGLVIINILFGILGIVVFAIGIWAITEDQNYSFVTGNSIVSGAALLIASGIITMIICFFGIIGAIFKLRPILILYAVAVLVVVILEIVAGIVAFVFSDDLIDQVNERSLDAIRRYRVPGGSNVIEEDVNDFVAFIQSSLDCCGVTNANDWFILNPDAILESSAGRAFPECLTCNATVDENCANFRNDSVFPRDIPTTTQGCGPGSSDRLTVFLYAVGGVGIAFGVLEILGILFALFLCCCITSARRQEVV